MKRKVLRKKFQQWMVHGKKVLLVRKKILFQLILSFCLFYIMQLSLFNFAPSSAGKVIWQLSYLAVPMNLILIHFIISVLRLVLRSGLLAYGVSIFLAVVFSFINSQKVAVLGEVFTLYDFFSVFHFGLLAEYVHLKDILPLMLLLIGVTAGVTILRRHRKNKTVQSFDRVRGGISRGFVLSLIFSLTLIFASDLRLSPWLKKLGVANDGWNPFADYKLNGAILSNVLSFTQSIIVPPPNYSRALVHQILQEFDEPSKVETKNGEPVSVIFYVMESLWDPKRLPVELNQDPLPTFHRLQEEGAEGQLVVPSFGGGTANTEFEILTGMPMYFEPPGSIPYVQYVKKPIMALPRLLRQHGYRTHAFHNFNQLYYKRYRAYPFLGFHSFSSIETMGHHDSVRGLPGDDILIKVMNEQMDVEDRPFFYHAVSMESHGPYDVKMKNPVMRVINSQLAPQFNNLIENYTDALWYADQSLLKLVTHLKKLKRKVTLVVMGDHLPALGENFGVYVASKMMPHADSENWSTEEWLTMRTTPLAVWNNFSKKPGLTRQAYPVLPTMSTNCLASKIFEILDIPLDPFFRFNADFCRKLPIFSPNLILNSEFKYFSTDSTSISIPSVWPASLRADGLGMPPLILNYRTLVYDRLDGENYASKIKN